MKNLRVPRSERVQWPRDRLHPQGSVESALSWEAVCERPSISIPMRSEPVFSSAIAAIGFYLAEEDANATVWGRKALAFCQELFFGSWRQRLASGEHHTEPPDEEWLRRVCSWRKGFELCLLWGSVLARWDELSHLATYFDDDLRVDIDQSEANRAWLLIVAGVLCNRPWGEMATLIETIRGGKAKREKLLLDFLDAILHSDDQQLAIASSAYFKYYKASEWKKPFITSKIMVDGSFLVHFAEHRGRQISIPENIADHLVRLPFLPANEVG